jgi:hypothetical protein
MKSIVSIIVGFGILALAIIGSFKVMNVMLVHNDAEVFLDKKICPVKLNPEGFCLITGSVTHNLAGDYEISSPNGAILTVPPQSVEVVTYQPDQSHYRPFGPIFAFVLGISILLAGTAMAFGIPLLKAKRSAGNAKYPAGR